MKKVLLFLTIVLLSTNLWAQNAKGFSYQAVVRNADGEPVSNQQIGVLLTIQDAEGTNIYYSEHHETSTSPQGVVSLVVGEGTLTEGDFEIIPWSGELFLKVEVDLTGDESFVELGTTRLQSVPLALFAVDGNEGPQGEPGADGLSAYELWLAEGNTGTEADFLAAMKGEKGEQGEPGEAGPQGNPGIDGKTILNGTVNPTSDVGVDGDFYLNTSTNEIFGPKASGAWPSTGVSLVGPQGPEGPLVSGNSGQILVNNGSGWAASSAIHVNSNNVGVGTTSPSAKLHVAGDIKSSGSIIGTSVQVGEPVADPDAPLFVVRNSNNEVVFAVYEEGVRMYVASDDGSKASKGGFAVGGLTQSKAGQEYFRVTPDSVRVYIDTATVEGKAASKGGFAVGGLTQSKGEREEFFRITRDSSRIYVNDNISKAGSKGGFAVGGLTQSKLNESRANFFNVSTNPVETITNEPRILWYPLKNAFMAGLVNISNANDVGENSMSMGYKNIAKGNYSQAFGYQSQALGQYSSAFGKNALANTDNTFAFGDGASANQIDSYAFGSGATADGIGSFAFGSYGRDTLTFEPLGDPTTAAGNYSFAIGLGASATGLGSTAIGVMSSAVGDGALALGISSIAEGDKSVALNIGETYGAYSMAFGRLSKATGDYSIALGRGVPKFGTYNHASGYGSIALGNSKAYGRSSVAIGSATVNGDYSSGMGHSVTVDGDYAVGLGVLVNAYSYGSTVVGWDNIESGDPHVYDADNPLFIVGNGTGAVSSNAMTVLWNGNVGIGTHTPNTLLHVAGDARIEGDIYYGTGTDVYTKPDFVFLPEYERYLDPMKVDEFIEKNGHLPWFTKATDEEEGVNLTRMQFETVETVENLQLQIINIKKEYQEQIANQQKEIDKLKAELEEIKAALRK